MNRPADEVPIEHQIAEVMREIALRGRVYPRFVASGKLRQGEAEEHIRRMLAVLETLKGLADDHR